MLVVRDDRFIFLVFIN